MTGCGDYSRYPQCYQLIQTKILIFGYKFVTILLERGDLLMNKICEYDDDDYEDDDYDYDYEDDN